MRSGALLAAGLAGAVLLAGCGSHEGPGSASDESTGTAAYPSPLVTEGGELVVTCGGGTGFPVSVLPDGLPDVLTQPEAVQLFTDLLADPAYAGELATSVLAAGPDDTEWRVLRDDGDAYTLGLGSWSADGPGPDGSVMYVQRHQGGWAWGGGGSCTLAPQLESGNTWVALSEPATPLDRESTSPVVGVTEDGCTGGRDPEPFLHDPVIVEEDDAVTVYWTSTPLDGAATCVANVPTELPLSLDEPLGDRELLDGSTYPPVPLDVTVVG
jgi:hypothetical protein